jgi:hypothetical protein
MQHHQEQESEYAVWLWGVELQRERVSGKNKPAWRAHWPGGQVNGVERVTTPGETVPFRRTGQLGEQAIE